MKDRFWHWLDGDTDIMDSFSEAAEIKDISREAYKARVHEIEKEIEQSSGFHKVERIERKGFQTVYYLVAVVSCVMLTGVLLYMTAHLPYFGEENPRSVEVVERYVEKGLEETGAVNIVSGMILDYRAFDTLGESHVLFTALVCVMVLLYRDKKNMRHGYEDYYTVTSDRYYGIFRDAILHKAAMFLIPCIFLFGIYILLNGQLSPGGGFSGGAVIGAGLIIFAASLGFDRVDRFFTRRFSAFVTLAALSFYSVAKGYVFFTGANGLETYIPKGTPCAILSGGLILPLDIAVGIVVACTMYGFYSLFCRGNIGGNRSGDSFE